MNSIPSSSVAAPSPQLAAAPLGRGAKAARDFEASLIGSLLQAMEKTFATLPWGKHHLPRRRLQLPRNQSLGRRLGSPGRFRHCGDDY